MEPRPQIARRLAVAATAAAAVVLAGVAVAPAQGSEPRIVGGSATTIEDWPWQVAIARPPGGGGDGYDRQFCGGSLVASTVVLTAAHCVYDTRFRPPREFSVITGRTTLSSNQGAEIAATDVIYFVATGSGPTPQSQSSPPAGAQLYDDQTSEWDVALIELASAAPAPAAPIAIASAAERSLWDPEDPAFVTGWGSTATAGGPYPDDLQEAEVEIVADSDCGSTLAYGSGFDPQTMVCAGIYEEGGKDTCQGDSGGPLVVPAGDGSFRLVGDTSFGEGCALPFKPGVYGRVADEPIRSAIVAGIAFAAPPAPPTPPPAGGVENPPSESGEEAGGDAGAGDTGDGGSGDSGGGDGAAADQKRPETTITKSPARRTRKRSARFAFVADELSSFECRLDRGDYKPCEPPFTQRVERRRRHTFRVRAVDVAGNLDATPAKYSWRVKRRR